VQEDQNGSRDPRARKRSFRWGNRCFRASYIEGIASIGTLNRWLRQGFGARFLFFRRRGYGDRIRIRSFGHRSFLCGIGAEYVLLGARLEAGDLRATSRLTLRVRRAAKFAFKVRDADWDSKRGT
jgi:hypothetical protein